MKRFTQLLTASIIFSLVIFVSCKKKGGGEDPEPEDKRDAVGTILSKTWTPSSVTKDALPRDEWADFKITFAYNTTTDKGNYTLVGVPTDNGGSDVWGDPTAITWTFGGTADAPVFTTITRSDGIEVTASYDDNSDPTTLKSLSFTITNAANRTEGFNGKWEFSF